MREKKMFINGKAHMVKKKQMYIKMLALEVKMLYNKEKRSGIYGTD